MTRFFTTTLITKYIKYLLANTPIPQYSFISENQLMSEGCLYTYKNSVLYCTKSGRFTGLNGTLSKSDVLYTQEDLAVNDPYFEKYGRDNLNMNFTKDWPETPKTSSLPKGWMRVTNKNSAGQWTDPVVMPLAVTEGLVSVDLYTPAEYDIVETFLPTVYKPGITQQYVSNVGYYDAHTHKWLGEYLRLLKNMYDLDLMCLYNCYNTTVVNNIILHDDIEHGNIKEATNIKKKVILVPIKFNKTYTVAIDSETPVEYCSVFYNNGAVYTPTNEKPLGALLAEPLHTKNSTQFKLPFAYTTEGTDKTIQKYERYLYLAIQVSQNNESTVVVLEGDYSRGSSDTCIIDVAAFDRENATVEELSSVMTSELSLLSANDGIQHPFADRLIEYLCRNTIDTREKIDDNVERVIDQLGNFEVDYKGQWSTELRYTLYSRYMKLKENDALNRKDILGYVDKDIENALRKGYLKE